MDRSRMELAPGLWLDARRAAWLEDSRSLVVADLHLGYVWAHRFGGQLLPLSAREDSTERLLALIDSYRPREVILLGDTVHRVVPVPTLVAEFLRLVSEVGSRATLRIVMGNHDTHLSSLLGAAGVPPETARRIQSGPFLLTHGDSPNDDAGFQEIAPSSPGPRVIIGHEHPAIAISDGISTRVKYPCFLSSSEVLVLPAFSRWAAGTNVREDRFLSYFARRAQFDLSIAILADKLLPVRLKSGSMP